MHRHGRVPPLTEINSGDVIHEPIWFGSDETPLFGMLTFPASTDVRGGVILAPPVGYEARAARRAFRLLATALGEKGYIVLRFDYQGTGDSSGDFHTASPNPRWLDNVSSAVTYLREHGVARVSAVGMRLGATLIGVAASHHQLNLESLVAWDPCESGGNFLRELGALESLRRKTPTVHENGVVETTEFLFTAELARSIRSLSLSKSIPEAFAQRSLVVTRERRPLSSALRAKLDVKNIEFDATTEQEELIEVHPFFAKMPYATIERITAWVTQTTNDELVSQYWTRHADSIIPLGVGERSVIERAIKIGPQGLFAITTEPVTGGSGPWIVLVGGIHEDHTGPSRLWVELSRRWAGAGLRCVRLDVSGMGETPADEKTSSWLNANFLWIRDIRTVASSLTPEDPSNCVYVGMCSGALLALQGALGAGARGVCLVNPPAWTDFAYAITRIQKASWKSAQRIARPLTQLLWTHPLASAALWHLFSWLLPPRWSTNVAKTLRARGTTLLVIAGPDDLSPLQAVPLLRMFVQHQSSLAKPQPFIYVPGLDHDMSSAVGRDCAARLLEEFVHSRYADSSLT